MQQHAFSRRHFARLATTGAALAAFPSLLARTPTAAPILLNSNENPYGPSPAAMSAIQDCMGQIFRYPDDPEISLAETIAASHGVTTSEVLLANGSSDVLRLAAFLASGKKIVTANPTFESLWHHARGSEIVKVPLDAAYAHDLPKMLEAAKDAALVYICNPNNPTATITPRAAIRAFLDAVSPSTTVLVDEAYHHYATSRDYESVAPLIRTKPNLIVARTFSKIYALAGLRCGYALAQKAMIERLAAHQAFNVMNLFALVAARASLEDTEHVAKSRQKNSDTREWLIGELKRDGYQTLPSEANFVMIDVRSEVKPMIAAMRERGVRVGRLFPAMPAHMRLTIGLPEEMRRFVEVFKAFGVR